MRVKSLEGVKEEVPKKLIYNDSNNTGNCMKGS
jgi:hypothetical protein